ncbi:YtkA-like [Paenibacillus sophorae]|uniref:FixH family protein n=1 Tax=Paenibacillus sophorae TaxID=1333845 RepID=A0A1H8G016_9BACL|nr:FixH family protein [Paenibacillus sophorae]QWU14035.1 FixH family protein [Paenibacillus sophorae]SEN37124.1 YtkA-like [Paenibacillus sophorae]
MLRPFAKWVLLFLLIAGALTGCSSGKNNHSGMNMSKMSMEPIKVELSWSPPAATVNQEITFEARVTQGGEPVDDAKEVRFEIVNTADAAKKLELTGKPVGEGNYTAEGMLAEAGSYSVTSHVTARTQHSMPTKSLTVEP